MMNAEIRDCRVCPFNSDGPLKRDGAPTCLIAAYTNDPAASAARTDDGLRKIDDNADDWCPIKDDSVRVHRS